MTDNDAASGARQTLPPNVRILTKGYIPGTNPSPRQRTNEHVPTKFPKGGSSIVPPPQPNSEKAK
jgi:hypothetical protein